MDFAPEEDKGRAMADDVLTLLRQQMIEIIQAHARFAREQLGRATLDADVLRAMGDVPRHAFVPAELRAFAYADQPLPIGFEKTISQPFIVALMTDLLAVAPGRTVLEIGTGLGYHAAVLARLKARVFSVEIVEELAEQATRRLAAARVANVVVRCGNGARGWPEHAPFDRILVCAGCELIPHALLPQLKPGGRMVVPTGLPDSQTLTVVEKGPDGRIKTTEVLPVRFSLLENGS